MKPMIGLLSVAAVAAASVMIWAGPGVADQHGKPGHHRAGHHGAMHEDKAATRPAGTCETCQPDKPCPKCHRHKAAAANSCQKCARHNAEAAKVCEACERHKAGAARVAKLEKLLAEAREAAGDAGAAEAVARIEEAQKVLAEHRRTAHRHMDDHVATHGEADASELCPMCARRKAEADKAEADTGVVNVRCPVMGGRIDPENVPAELTRTYKGRKVGFCCAGCPVAWDALGDEEKAEKLRGATDRSEPEGGVM